MTRLKSGVDIQSIAFADSRIEIVYAEERDVNSQSGIIEFRTIVIPMSFIEEAGKDLLDSAQELVDAALIKKRNPAAAL